jgi:proteasome-associated ATPase
MDQLEMKKLLTNHKLSAEAESKALLNLIQGNVQSLPQISKLLVNRKRRMQEELAEAKKKCAAVEDILKKILEPPLHPAIVLRERPQGGVDVLAAGRRQIVGKHPKLGTRPFQPGDEVLLNADQTAIVARGEHCCTGPVATVAESADGKVVIRGPGDEEIAALCPPTLAATLAPGDRVVYLRDFPCIIERLPERTQSPFILQEAPDVSFDDIGGLDELIAEVRRDLDLHLLHKERVSAYQLRLLSGMVLVGSPGVGKSLIAMAIANYLARVHSDARFIYVAPGSLRAQYYGASEERIRELFDVARSAPGIVVMFMDELDTYGGRGVGIGQELDGRVLGALLSAIDGLGAARNVLCIGASNRLDLCDPALVREGRFGDRIYAVQRPRREATRQILSKYLKPELPYADLDGVPGSADDLIDGLSSYLHAHEGGAAALAHVTYTNGDKREVAAADVLSGALLQSAVERAKHVAAQRELEGDGGIRAEDLFAAVEDALAAEARKLSAPLHARQVLDDPRADDIVHVEVPCERRIPRHRYMRAV